MKRRDLLKVGFLTAAGAPFLIPRLSSGLAKPEKQTGKVKNIIFLVSDGMSIGTLTMANLLSQRKYGRDSHWIDLYKKGRATRGVMDTSSANSMVTDSAAASSSWGGGMKINNGGLNIGPNGERPVPILQKFKKAGKAVGCVTTVPITHATPAGFCINNESRKNQPEIALQYIPLQFDVMMGGGLEFFDASLRKDGKDVFGEYVKNGWQVVQSKEDMQKITKGKPVLGVFSENGLPYTVDHVQSAELLKKVPTLAEMLQKSIELMSENPNGFVIQVEGGKVDWAAHSNDTPALVYDQLAFDEAVGVAIAYAEKRNDTLVVITTDHGNANPGLFYGKNADRNFDKLLTVKHSNEWVFQQFPDNVTVEQVLADFKTYQQVELKPEQAATIAERFKVLSETDKKDNRKLPFEETAFFQREHFSVHFGDMNHSGDYVELAMFGPGSEALKPFTVNTELYNFMLQCAGLL
jgi:alkaline phosphatase